MTLDGYTAEFDASETSEVTIDLVMTILIGVVSFATLIGLIWVIGYLKKKIPRF